MMRLLPLAGLSGSLLLSAFLPAIAAAQPPSTAGRAAGGGIEIREVTRLIPANGRPIPIEVNKGVLVRLALPARTVFVANPDIADVQVKSSKLIYITAKTPGETVIYAVDAGENVLLNAPIHVSLDLSRLRRSLQELVPGARIATDSVANNLVLSGN